LVAPEPLSLPVPQRFWVEAPHPFIGRERLQEALRPEPGMNVLEVGPGTGYYTLETAKRLMPGGSLQIFDLQQQMLDHTMRRAEAAGVGNVEPRRASSPIPTRASTRRTWSPS
jgi:precorrin-6B methylase 2